MTADDCNKLQVIQNSLNRLLTGARKGTPTKDEHDVNHADGGAPDTNNGAQGDTDRQARVYRQQTGSSEWN